MADVVGDDEGWENVQNILNAMSATERDELVERLTAYAVALDNLCLGVSVSKAERLANVTPALSAKAFHEAANRIQADAATIAAKDAEIAALKERMFDMMPIAGGNPMKQRSGGVASASALKGGDHG